MNQFALISSIAWQIRPGRFGDDRICRPWWDDGRLVVCNNCLLIAFDMPTPPKFVIVRDQITDRVSRPPCIQRFLSYCEGVHDLLPLPEIAGPSTIIRPGWNRYDGPPQDDCELQAEAARLIEFRGIHFRHEFLWILSQLPGLMTLPPVPGVLTLPFVFEGGRGCLQPVVDEAEMAEAAKQADEMVRTIGGGPVDENAAAAAVSLAEDEAGVGA